MKLELLVPLTYMHILHTSGNTKREPDLSFLDSVGLLRVCVRVCVSFCYSPHRKGKLVCSNVHVNLSPEFLNTEDGRLAVHVPSEVLCFLCSASLFVLTCFSVKCNSTKAPQTHSSLMLILFHFPASLPITVILNKGTERKRDAECRVKKTENKCGGVKQQKREL